MQVYSCAMGLQDERGNSLFKEWLGCNTEAFPVTVGGDVDVGASVASRDVTTFISNGMNEHNRRIAWMSIFAIHRRRGGTRDPRYRGLGAADNPPNDEMKMMKVERRKTR